ncbi:MAG: tetratricopeptide repeat protein [Xanthomonadales bacterium]|nr:tetratricopeptide repeat protein [Xanthomonadales bacterium]
MGESLHQRLSGFIAELRGRKVLRAAVAYAVVGWLLLQIGEVTFAPLHLPDWALTALVVLVISGFPLVLIISWYFELRPPRLLPDSAAGKSGIIRTPPAPPDDLPSVAVLPFADMSPDSDQQYLCDGVAEAILSALTRIERLHTSARTSSFQFRGQSIDVREIGRQLGVQSVLEGSVRTAGEQLRVTAELINVADGYRLWSNCYDGELGDLFTVQDEIAESIARSMVETLQPHEQSAIKSTFSQDILAYQYYLRGREFFNRFRKKDMQFARQMFRQAIDIDPNFSLAWAGYADCFSFLVMYEDPQEDYREEARVASRKAVNLNPDLAEAHASRGLALLISDDYARADAEFAEALTLNPKLYEAYYYSARARFHQGHLKRAAELFARAAEVSPGEFQARLLRVQILRGLGQMDLAVKEAAEAIEVVERHLEWYPDDTRALHLGAGSLIVLGQTERAIRWLNRAVEIDPTDSVVLYNLACNYATLGDVEKAFEYLEQSVEHGTVSAAWMRNDEDLAPLRGDPRFDRLLQNLPQQGKRKRWFGRRSRAKATSSAVDRSHRRLR